jgi:hypothetical protein
VVLPAPSWLIDKCGTAAERVEKETEIVHDAPDAVVARAAEWLAGHPGAVEGEGGDAHTYATACRLRDFGLSPVQALQALGEHWNERCSPPWTIDELEVKIGNAYRYAQEGAAGKLAVSAADFEAMPAPAPGPREAYPPALLRLLEMAERMGKPQPYLVKGVLQRASHAVLYGAPGEGKTFVALDLAYHVAAGREWMSHRVKPGLVLYLAYEGMGGIQNRAAALIRHYGKDDVPLYVRAADFNLREQAGRAELGALLAELPEKPALIVIDTLARALKGGDENSAQDMGALNDAVVALIANTGACVMLIHHSGKNKAQGARGSSALLGAIDTELQVDTKCITPTKQRDVEMADPMGFRLHSVLLGIDEDGDEITSCVVMPAAAMPDSKGGKLRGVARLAWERLCELRPNNTPIDPAEWREACSEFLPKWRGALYQHYKRMEKSGLIVINDDGTIQRKMEG